MVRQLPGQYADQTHLVDDSVPVEDIVVPATRTQLELQTGSRWLPEEEPYGQNPPSRNGISLK